MVVAMEYFLPANSLVSCLMTNPARLATMLRFHLSELSPQNAHHQFEHLARHLARARLYSNILPATGPVSAGGDGGKDFETFRTHAINHDPGSMFADRASGQRVVAFACTLEKKIEAKIRKDVKTIAAGGGVDELVVLCEPNVAIGKRNKLITEAKAKGFELRIFDGNALAEWLSEPDLFWIAEEYLKIPAELFPVISQDKIYLQHKQEWASRKVLPVSMPDFVSVKSGLRKATFDPESRPDLGFWLLKMEGFVAENTPRGLMRSAAYEIAVANLRGRNDLTNQSDRLTDYFSDLDDFVAIGDLTNATTLLTYTFGAFWLGNYRGDEKAIYEWRDKIRETLESCLAAEMGPGQRAGYLNIVGMLELLPKAPGKAPELGDALLRWQSMLDCVGEARLFPLEPFADYIVKIVGFYGSDPGLENLANRVEDMLALRVGTAAAGKKALDRALSLIERDEATAAIRTLHATKAKWFSGEMIESVIRILLLLSEQYCRLGLTYAGKYHAMVGAFLARYEPHADMRQLEPECLLALLDAEQAAGNSFGFLQLLPVYLDSHVRNDHRPLELERHPELAGNLGQLAALIGFLGRGNRNARAAIAPTISQWPEPIKTSLLVAADAEDGFWMNGSWEEAWEGLEEALFDRPFGDLGPQRCVRWKALGLNWSCRFSNDYLTTPHAEQVISDLQLIACAMAGKDLGLVPCAIDLHVTVVEGSEERIVVTGPTPEDKSLYLLVSAADRVPDQSFDTMIVFATAMRACSVLDDESLMSSFDRSSLEAMFTGRPYSELYREFLPPEIFDERVRVSASALDPDRPFECRAGDRVEWVGGPGPTFNQARAEEDVRRRYDWAGRALRFTLEAAMQNSKFLKRLISMHEEGKTDWEILSVLNNVAVAARGFAPDQMTPENRELALRAMEFVEHPGDALPVGIFSEQKIDAYSKVYVGAFAASWQLNWPECATYDQMERFLIARYALRSVDLPHEMRIDWEAVKRKLK
ncbi:hypothetical protein RE411_23485 (plasmid) [Agrobacterium pusense]|uniref:hypothetical protein n=1 Tax=Agrobacterium pusense TaxID=648995 RepID=UPI0007D87F4E|nr:hypothetical protein [Agrobacterium pusense]OAI83054.1 hypothetical protein AYO27_18115 [Rhizobium sp. GHKF11]WMW59122.1 hypothetical protein RE411_23485 [Agrobacterium pusense]